MTRVLLFWLALVITVSCKKAENKYLHSVGYIDPATSLGDKDFKTCSDMIFEYYNSEPDAGYKHGKNILRDSVKTKYNYKGNDSGYLTFRFVVNCKGLAGRYQIVENDLDFKPKQLNQDLVQHLFTITQELKDWKQLVWEKEPRDYYMYITYKLQDGKIIEILP
ncbi:MAG: hypothetical protein KA713_06600 [Chryseotalea sp. WA131a]|jgi:hypothetical protein|nr:MAG: hypothetical protein KA713_06600 [Chryseotalea sp. WA131a]